MLLGMPKVSGNIYLLVWAVVLLILNGYRLAVTLKLHTKINSNEFAYDPRGNARELPLSVTNAVMNSNDDHLLDIHAENAWKSVLPTGNGWAIFGPPNYTVYSVSMYHQIHCINSMRHDLIQARSGESPSHTVLTHATHCYNYIRQGLLCKADITLEPSVIRVVNGRKQAAASGNGVDHVCRDWSQVQQFLDKTFRNRYKNWRRLQRP